MSRLLWRTRRKCSVSSGACGLCLTGSDPSKLVEEIAKRKKKRVMGVSLGQGQDVIARRLIATAFAEGHWVLLQNAHLGLAYLSEVGCPSPPGP